jgi:hypothetical protein
LMRQMKRGVFCSGSVQPLYHARDHGQLAKGSFNASKRHRIFQSRSGGIRKSHQDQAAKSIEVAAGFTR